MTATFYSVVSDWPELLNVPACHRLQAGHHTATADLVADDEHVRVIPCAWARNLGEALGPLRGQCPKFYDGAQALPGGLDVQPITPQIAVELQLRIWRLHIAAANFTLHQGLATGCLQPAHAACLHKAQPMQTPLSSHIVVIPHSPVS